MRRELPTLAVFDDDIGVPRTLLETFSLLIAMVALAAFAGMILRLALLTVLYATGANWVRCGCSSHAWCRCIGPGARRGTDG